MQFKYQEVRLHVFAIAKSHKPKLWLYFIVIIIHHISESVRLSVNCLVSHHFWAENLILQIHTVLNLFIPAVLILYSSHPALISPLPRVHRVHICVTHAHTQEGVAERFIADVTDTAALCMKDAGGPVQGKVRDNIRNTIQYNTIKLFVKLQLLLLY